MNSAITENSRIREATAGHTTSPEYDSLPASIKLIHTPEQYKWLGSERERILERETMPDWDVIE